MSYSFIKHIATGYNFSTSLLKLEVNVVTVFKGYRLAGKYRKWQLSKLFPHVKAMKNDRVFLETKVHWKLILGTSVSRLRRDRNHVDEISEYLISLIILCH